MESLHGNRELPCTLERLQDDETARAPEPLWAATTLTFSDLPELDDTSLTPQVSSFS